MALVTYDTDGDIALIQLNRPEKRNALSDKMLIQLSSAVDRAADEAKAVVVSGAGKDFCGGRDLSDLVNNSVMQGVVGSRHWHEIFTRIQRGPVPYFCALHGAVVGGGMEIAAAMHVRVAETGTSFAMPEGQRGIFVGGGGSVNISRLIGVSRMTDMMLTGRVLSADEAERYGAVNYVVNKGAGVGKAIELAKMAAMNAPLANYAIINALPRIHNSGHDEGLFFESMIASLSQTTPEAHAGLRAFLDKKAARLNIPTAQAEDG